MPYLADVYPEGVNTYDASDWLEAIENDQPGGGDAFSLEGGEAVLVVEVPWEKARAFVRFVLGWSYATSEAPWLLRRENPQPHPRFDWLTAGSVTFAGRAPVGVAGVGTKVAGAYGSSLPVGKYEKLIATVRFVDRPWTFRPDWLATTPAQESLRNTYFDPVPTIEIISAEGINNIEFANTAPPDGPVLPKRVPAPFGTLMAKTTYTLNWMYVPHEYISGANTLIFAPTKIEACTGRVNSAEFMGFQPMTLLMQPPQYTRFKFPMQTADRSAFYYGWNIKIPLQFFDPEMGVPADFASYRGHQLVPFRDNLKWYGAKRANGTSKLYPEADFNQIFEHVSA